mmetsp:Transcript_673/g.620  ORF Transcript_673/g.620 Transcript_673/m.620 type:complete len:98 (-) Transcript_673:25-318(-)
MRLASCASDDWTCIGESSEFDFFFVNLRKSSPNFGMVKHIVNNCDEETVFTEAPFDRFLDLVEAFTAEQATEDHDDGDLLPLHSYKFRRQKKKSRNR